MATEFAQTAKTNSKQDIVFACQSILFDIAITQVCYPGFSLTVVRAYPGSCQWNMMFTCVNTKTEGKS